VFRCRATLKAPFVDRELCLVTVRLEVFPNFVTNEVRHVSRFLLPGTIDQQPQDPADERQEKDCQAPNQLRGPCHLFGDEARVGTINEEGQIAGEGDRHFQGSLVVIFSDRIAVTSSGVAIS
jgi:hypothetical protein